MDWPDVERKSDGYARTCGACNFGPWKETFQSRKEQALVEVVTICARDGVPFLVIHNVMLGREEYLDAFPDDALTPEQRSRRDAAWDLRNLSKGL